MAVASHANAIETIRQYLHWRISSKAFQRRTDPAWSHDSAGEWCLRTKHHTTRGSNLTTTSPRSSPDHSSPPPLSIDTGQFKHSDMSSFSIFRAATRAVRPTSFVRAPLVQSRLQTPVTLAARYQNFGTTSKLLSGHDDETYEQFSSR